MKSSTICLLFTVIDLVLGLRAIDQMGDAVTAVRVMQLQTYAQFWIGSALMSAMFTLYQQHKGR